jgi:hypothetical protein
VAGSLFLRVLHASGDLRPGGGKMLPKLIFFAFLLPSMYYVAGKNFIFRIIASIPDK